MNEKTLQTVPSPGESTVRVTGTLRNLSQLVRESSQNRNTVPSFSVKTNCKSLAQTLRLRAWRLTCERYLMKKPTEDVYVLVDENNEPIEK